MEFLNLLKQMILIIFKHDLWINCSLNFNLLAKFYYIQELLTMSLHPNVIKLSCSVILTQWK
jgi:hypothetical protein